MFLFFRRQQKDNREGRLKKETKDQLKKLPGCKLTTQKEGWEKQYASLKAFLQVWQQSNLEKMRTWRPKDIKDESLRRWVIYQRRDFRIGLLASREKALLDIPGWRWADRKRPKTSLRADCHTCKLTTQKGNWEKHDASLKASVQTWQESNSEKVHTWKSKDIEDQSLRRWVFRQKKEFRAGFLTKDREKNTP